VRKRLLASSFGIALAAVLVLGIPLGVVATRLVRQDARTRLQNEAQRVARAVDRDLESRRLPTQQRLAELIPSRHTVVVSDRSGRQVRAGPADERSLHVRALAADGASVVVTAPRNELDERAGGIWLAILLLAIAGLVAALLLGLLQSRRFARPLERLAADTLRLGSGDFTTRAGRHPLPEVQAVAAALDRSAERLAEVVDRERAFNANVSHQLRTPLTALSLRLEELRTAVTDPVLREEVDAALVQADRLERTIDSLLALARVGRAGHAEAIDAAAVARDHGATWRRTFGERDRRLEVEAPGSVEVRVTPSAFEQALDVLLENALVHGAGAARISVLPAERHVAVRVTDEGAGVAAGAEEAIFERSSSERGGTGLGLGLARGLIEADGGRVRLVDPCPATFEILLPRDPAPSQ
jgi:signal transduction histidine kinase